MQEVPLKDLRTLNELEQGTATSHFQNKGEKSLSIPDFVSKPHGVVHEEEGLLNLASGSNAHFVLRSRVKPRVDQVSLAMWVSANARILQQLLMKIPDTANKLSVVDSYLDYTAQIGDLCQTYSTPSVMLVDDTHRKQQAKDQGPWNKIDMHTMFYHLEKKVLAKSGTPEGTSRKPKGQRPVDSQGREICISFNSASGCKYQNCKFRHVCPVTGCQGTHPQSQHSYNMYKEDTPPRFRQP